MSKFSNHLENALINATLRNIPYSSPSTVYVALYTTDPTDSDTGNEVAGGSYARQVVTFTAPVNGETGNTADVTFPVATANWGTVTHIGLKDAASGGNLLYHSPLTSPRNIEINTQIIFLQGEIKVTLL